jgi:flagellar hook-associated protein 3
MIRISSQQIFNGGINRLQNLNSQINNTQEQVSTGKKVNKPSDDPVAAARILKLDQEVQRIETYNRNATLATNRLELEESTLDSATDILQRVRELTVQAGSGTLSNNDRASLAAELRQRLDQLADVANTQDASGEYIFSGFQGKQAAFEKNISGSWVYQGDEGQRQLEIDDGVTVAINDHGKGIFSDVASAQPTFITSADPANASGAQITTGAVEDQALFNEFYAGNKKDLVVEFQGGDYYVRERDVALNTADPNTYLETGAFSSGDSIVVQGARFEIIGNPQDGDRFNLQTAEKQSVFNTIEKVIYGLENDLRGPATATLTSFTPNAGDQLRINGETLGPFAATDGIADLADAINSNTALRDKGISAVVRGTELAIEAQGQDLSLSATDGGDPPTQIFSGVLVSDGAKADELDVSNGVLNANFASGDQAYQELIANSLTNLDNAQESIVLTQTDLGARMNAVESTQQFLEDSGLYSKKIRSQLQDVDYAEAISNLSFQSFVLQAAQQSFAQVSRLSLFDRL